MMKLKRFLFDGIYSRYRNAPLSTNLTNRTGSSGTSRALSIPSTTERLGRLSASRHAALTDIDAASDAFVYCFLFVFVLVCSILLLIYLIFINSTWTLGLIPPMPR
ncbi:unnamed protein product [Gongylonema pulchrum]|uniref:Uncharacterized protein n=1 Tax=Gongylonema pulchrum TaxID=637853 RepID=A0A183CZJ1_9BILA|nr:unnamed protein product [Gongylonema pulchrum]